MGIFEDGVSADVTAEDFNEQMQAAATQLFGQTREKRFAMPFDPLAPSEDNDADAEEPADTDATERAGSQPANPLDPNGPTDITDPNSLFAARFFAGDPDFAPGNVYTETTT